MDAVAVVSAPADQQRARVLARPNMTVGMRCLLPSLIMKSSRMCAEKYESLLARQLPDEVKRQWATYVIDTVWIECAHMSTDVI